MENTLNKHSKISQQCEDDFCVISSDVQGGYSKIANTFVEVLAMNRIPGAQTQCLWVVFRKTVGWKKSRDKIALSQFVQMTGLKKQHVSRALDALAIKKIITVTQNGERQPNTFEINPGFDEWSLSPKKGISPKMVMPIPNNGDKPIPKFGDHKRKEKTLIQKKTFPSDSDEFRLSELLFQEIKANKPDYKEPNFQSWAKDFDFMIRRDKRTPERIEAVIKWAQNDSFWKSNILSPGKLRKQFDALEMKMTQPGQMSQPDIKPHYASEDELLEMVQ